MNPALVALLAAFAAQPVSPTQLRGVIVDVTGTSVAGASVSSDGRSVATDARGAFSLDAGGPEATLTVRAQGYADYAARVRAPAVLRIVLQPAGIAESLTVTAARSQERLAATATATAVLPASILLTSAALTADDALRSVPGFSLFRRSSSRVANPTTQGASLRGLAASGASRALVLADGVPMNDPFGGWIYWNRVPQAAIDRIEVVRGGSAELYGHESIAGTIQVLTVDPAAGTLRAGVEAGQGGMARGTVYGGIRVAAWSAFAAGERFVLDGFPVVAPDDRGPVDIDAGVKYSSALASIERRAERWSLGVRAGALDEDRSNGTPLQRNDTNLRSVSARARGTGTAGAWAVAASGGTVDYDQSFSAVRAGRAAEMLTARQRVASAHQSASVQWTSAWNRHWLTAGGDLARVVATPHGEPEVSQRDYAAYAQISTRPSPRLTIAAGARAGAWSTGPAGVERRQRVYVMPRVSAAWSAGEHVSVHASWTRPGRTPTLNELYRDFQVGNTTTFANGRLTPERAGAFEGGVLLRAPRGSARLVGFWTKLGDAITNVTLDVAAGRISRERQNAGHIRARGLELEGEWRPSGWTALAASAALLDSRFTGGVEPGLTGRRVPQVPRWVAAASLRLTPGRAVATLDVRSTGAQFDDDRNQFVLRRATVADLYAGVALRRIQPFVAVENVFDAEVDVGRTPVRTIGTPRTARAGVRFYVP